MTNIPVVRLKNNSGWNTWHSYDNGRTWEMQ